MAKATNGDGGHETREAPLTPSCGLVMPISSIDGCTADHWNDVKTIITEAIESIVDPKFAVRLVSDADDVGVIQKRIVQNLYTSDVVICDVSGKNPNVMFELGMRLAFDKPTVIVKDDKTDYAFDTGIIEHIPYPRDLRFNRMVAFKTALSDKVLATHKAAKADPNHSTFLKNFGKFHVASLNQDIVPADRVVVEMLSEVQLELSRLRRTLPRDPERSRKGGREDGSAELILAVTEYLNDHPKTDISALVGNVDFHNEMQDRCHAPRYFSHRGEFTDTLDRVMAALARNKSESKTLPGL